MEYCSRCVYPANAKPTILIDDDGVCSGCRYHESRTSIDWSGREAHLRELLQEHAERARQNGSSHDCIIPVGGGKDSHYQAHIIKEVYGLNPLLVTYNHNFNTSLGLRNLRNMVERFGCDLIRYTSSTGTVKKLSRYMLERVGDLTWHYHAGIRTFPFQVAVQHQIPLIVWGEHGFAELTGLVTLEDMVEFTKWTRQEHDMRGLEPEDLIDADVGITRSDLAPFVYPSDEAIEDLDVRGIYLSNFMYWDALAQAKFVRERYNFELHPGPREKSFILHGKTDDHANEVHDYLKYLKFGYGRATDDASTEIRHGRMTREEGIELVERYDSVVPSTLHKYLDFLDVTPETFYMWVDSMRDVNIWSQDPNGSWHVTDSVANHRNDPRAESARVPLVDKEQRTFGESNRGYYWQEREGTPGECRESSVDEVFTVL